MKRWMPLLIALSAASPTWAAERDEPADGEATLFDRLLVTPREDAFSDGDRRRAQIERSLPGMTVEEARKSGFDVFIEEIADADINKASPGQKVMIEKLNDPDFNRLPR